jgi:hypothetical protein
MTAQPDLPRRAPAAVAGGRRWPAWLARALAEATLIALSVLLALAVDEWRDARDRVVAAPAR